MFDEKLDELYSGSRVKLELTELCCCITGLLLSTFSLFSVYALSWCLVLCAAIHSGGGSFRERQEELMEDY